jgi:AcrR family transcriptional regulator
MTSAEPLDRRRRRRQETIEEIIEVAIDVMAESGVAGLSLGEVARRMGMRPPSLYVYFDSKHGLYDAVFRRGWQAVLHQMTPAYAGLEDATDLPAEFLSIAGVFLRWMVEHPVQAELMSWRPVPGYQPSAEAYEPAVAVIEQAAGAFAQLQRRGLFRRGLDPQLLLRTWTALVSGLMTQQLANASGEPYDGGRFSSLLPEVAAMFLARYAPPTKGKR